MRRFMALGALSAAALTLTTGCATKGWVQDLVTKKTAEVDQRTTQRIDGVEGRVEGVGVEVKEAHGAAREAQTAARGALGRADDVDSRLTRLWSSRHTRKLVDTTHLQFAFDRADLSDAAQTTLAGLVKELKANPGLTVDLEGYADPVGKRDYNVALSQRRVEAVRRYLVGSGIELSRIFFVGLGQLDDSGLSNAQKRRVTLKLMVAAD
jgi:outer membrane protein OmpA-like peptidoglycan-associated protein